MKNNSYNKWKEKSQSSKTRDYDFLMLFFKNRKLQEINDPIILEKISSNSKFLWDVKFPWNNSINIP